ncbi:MAG: hypothetical protein A3B30_01165 [Candidatus Komeilibacteria bacterium RIFCSPLOWO2_01_FULL_52_15]|uniref:Uncharacterized protein n=1 Tax=Candidatus Komeilibacteria bacterium RIFCSPLOWO2_01_FULL_52_15 TaxID=1798551 RepID=A0A1G2BS51_9BACT|nr:MAG: hypothetical protein A3B30_01165 [Candidatus Komeilibacteria bacterium RIFCSPLOWO2_01_FULL_52_15]
MEDKNQNRGVQPAGLIVKDVDGKLKILAEGELKEIDALLAETLTKTAPSAAPAAHNAGQEIAFPRFTDQAPPPADVHFKEPDKPSAPGGVAQLHFHPDDQRQIALELEKINTLFNINDQRQFSVIKIADKLLEKHTVRFGNERRSAFIKLLLSYFRQSRSLVQTRDMLTAPESSNGFALSAGTADHMVAVLKHLKKKIEEQDGIVVEESEAALETPIQKPASMPVVSRVAEQPVQAAPSAVPRQIPRETQAVRPLSLRPRARPVEPAPPAVPMEQKTAPAAPPQPVTTPVSSVPPLKTAPGLWPDTKSSAVPPPPREAPVTPAQPATPIQRPEPTHAELPKVFRPDVMRTIPIVEDVKRPTSRWRRGGAVMGRIDELSAMDLAMWRLLDPDPRIRAGKILGRIQNLEQESLTRKHQGIDAWRSNEVYQLYLMLGQISLEQKKDVAAVIQELQSAGRQTLAIEEFEAISDLNRMLRF